MARCAAGKPEAINWANAVCGTYLLSVEDFNTLKLNALGYIKPSHNHYFVYSLLAFAYQFSLPIIIVLNGIFVYLCRVY